MNHFIEALVRFIAVVYIVLNNETYSIGKESTLSLTFLGI